MSTSPLQLESVSKSFGGVHAVVDVSFDLPPGQITALIGPNGAGKTTVINLIAGVLKASRGRCVLLGEDVAALSMHERAQRGLARTYQTPQIIRGLTVLENVMTGCHRFGRTSLARTIVAPWTVANENRTMAARASECLKRADVASDWWGRMATDLPYGHQRRVEIARAMAQDPKVLLLDEPAAGLNPNETHEIGGLLQDIAADGCAVLLVEHDMPLVMSIAEKIVVLNFGQLLATGSAAEVAENPEVIAAYLGDASVVDEELAA